MYYYEFALFLQEHGSLLRFLLVYGAVFTASYIYAEFDYKLNWSDAKRNYYYHTSNPGFFFNCVKMLGIILLVFVLVIYSIDLIVGL